MSLLDAWIGRDRLLVVVDTMACRLDEDRSVKALGSCSKVASLPHARTVIASRGSVTLFAFVMCACQKSISLADFDLVDASMPDVLASAMKLLCDVAGRAGATVAADEQEVLIAGWSPSRGRMAGVLYRQTSVADGFIRTALGDGGPDYIASPWDAGQQGVPREPSTVDAAVDLAWSQYEHEWTEKRDFVPIGGRLVVVTLTRDSVVMKEVDDFGACTLEASEMQG